MNSPEKDIHLVEKSAVNDFHLSMQQRSREENFDGVVASFDLQKVLSTPHGDGMLIGFSRKLAVYNLTVYNSGEKQGLNYIWNETQARRGANEIASCVVSFLRDCDAKGKREVFLFCDSCGGQNKNRGVMFAVHQFLCRAASVKEVTVTYLVPGHTYMQCDAIHAAIETHLKGVNVWAPSQWPTIIACCVKDPQKNPVIVKNVPKVLKWKERAESAFPLNSRITDGGKVKWAAVRQFNVEESDLSRIRLKYSMDANYLEVPIRRRRGRGQGGVAFDIPETAYEEKLPISYQKYEDLLKLCRRNPPVIPAEYHEEFFSLRPDREIIDRLPEPDIEETEADDTDL